MTLIDLQALRDAQLEKDPYRYAVVPHSFHDDDAARALNDGFAVDGFVRSERRPGSGGGKHYLMHNRTLVSEGRQHREAVDTLPDAWRRLVDEVTSDSYRDALVELTGADLDGCTVEARMTRYSSGCWIQPHTDRPDKAVTHLFYFNDTWRSEWQGDLHVLRGPDMKDVARRVLPLLGTSVVLVRSDDSWHGVPPVSEGCPDDRRALLVHFART
ncbi:2OG-Fe(II) oxygenase [Streptomyces asoensis]|uniref:2OG-Fe(II) oxygenase n=1 Tax=Streptomyces asoensis TaxID=249586 RepID=UPI0033DCB796